MPKPEQTPEPSIEEILASIRRIIADDAPASAVHLPPADEEREERMAAPRRRPAEHASGRSEDEVLELTDFMVAEEAPAMALQEPAEPEEFSQRQGDDNGDDTGLYRDPYDESFARRAARAEQSKPAPQPSESREESGGMFSAVMAEVRRFTDHAPPKEPLQAHASEPEDNWGQPDLEALTSGLSRGGAARPVWSARHKEADDRRDPSAADPQSRRMAQPDVATGRQPDLASPESWSRGVQMQVSEAGPALPFPPEEEIAPRSNPLVAPASQDSVPAAEAPSMARQTQHVDQTGTVAEAEPARQNKQGKAEELADRAVSDFTTDRIGAPAVVADILKGDKPLMEAITSSLASALSRETEDGDEFEEAPHPEDFADDIFEAEQPEAVSAVQQPVSSQSKSPALPGIVGLDGGFVELHPVTRAPAGLAPAPVDQEMPELPREEHDDMVSAATVSGPERPAYRSVGTPEPVMPNLSAPASPAPSFPVAGRGVVREAAATPVERVQAASGPKSLEDTIKEMLKPLLMQWLDENMPRIVNEALREEMAANGLLPKAREARR